jgi:hypothetical protein
VLFVEVKETLSVALLLEGVAVKFVHVAPADAGSSNITIELVASKNPTTIFAT